MLQQISVDEITRVISLATAPAFLLGAVAGMLSLPIGRLDRISDHVRRLGEAEQITPAQFEDLKSVERRSWLTRLAITGCIHCGIITGWMVVLVFVDALFGFQNSPDHRHHVHRGDEPGPCGKMRALMLLSNLFRYRGICIEFSKNNESHWIDLLTD